MTPPGDACDDRWVHSFDRLSALDSTFLNFEHPHAPMHVAGLYLFEGEPQVAGRPGLLGLFRTVEERLPEVPRYRQRVVEMPLGIAHPVWADDPDFDLSYHLRRAALPRPGGMRELIEYVARIHARPLDRRRPLWEMYLIEGLEDGRMALYSKVHHAMVDGVSGIDLATILLDLDPMGRPPAQPARPTPAALPSGAELTRELIADGAGRLVRSALGALRNPQRVPRAALRSLGGAPDLRRLAGLLRPAPQSPINVPVGAARRISLVSIPLARAKAVKNALGGTVNDVVLAVVGESLDHFLQHRGIPHVEEIYRVMVPVSVRDETERSTLGNRVAAIFVDLPVGPMPARRRLAAVSSAMHDLKERRQAVAADRLVGLAGWAPATLHGLAGRLEYAHQRILNTVVSNVPGVQFPIYAGGARLLEAYPLLPLSANVALVICVTSYDGGLYFGLIGDYDALPDLDIIAGGLRRGFDRLEIAALEKSRGGGAVARMAPEPSEVHAATRGRGRRSDPSPGMTPRSVEVVGTRADTSRRPTSSRRPAGSPRPPRSRRSA